MVLWILLVRFGFRLRVSHSLRMCFPPHSANLYGTRYSPNPKSIATLGLASSAFARHYSRNLGWFLFLPVLRCFSSRGSPRNAMDSRYVPWFFTMGVSSFGNLRVNAYLQLTAAYRSLSRPSSAPDAKAFALRSYSLELLLHSFLYLVLVLWIVWVSYWTTRSGFLLTLLRCEKAIRLLHFVLEYSTLSVKLYFSLTILERHQ